MDSKTRQKLKAKAHSLKPVVIVGGNGLTDSVQNEIDCALQAHELIKIRVNAESKAERQQLASEICEHQQADLINMIGHIVTIYRVNPEG